MYLHCIHTGAALGTAIDAAKTADQATPVPAHGNMTVNVGQYRFDSPTVQTVERGVSVKMKAERFISMVNLCAAMAQWLAHEHWSTVPDDHAVLESRNIGGAVTCRITAGMIREANR